MLALEEGPKSSTGGSEATSKSLSLNIESFADTNLVPFGVGRVAAGKVAAGTVKASSKIEGKSTSSPKIDVILNAAYYVANAPK